jgi:hypothetical protein
MAVGLPLKTTYANGDVYSASDVNDTNGTVNLFTSSTLSVAGGKNCIINGGMDIWQRGTTFNSSTSFTADRWVVFPAAGTLNVTRSTDVPTSPYFSYSLQIAGVSSSGDILRQRIESAQVTSLAGQTVTLSIYAKSSAGSAPLKWNTQVPSVTDNFTTVVQDQSGTFSASPSSSWTRYTATFTISANAVRGYELRIFRDSSASSNTTLITGVQIELGATATTFSEAGGTIQGELAACQRYYYRASDGGAYNNFGLGIVESGTQFDLNFVLPVQMRVTPTSVDFSTLTSQEAPGGTLRAVTSVGIGSSTSGRNTATLTMTVASGLTANRVIRVLGNNSTSAYIGVSAEL